jgi:hypothetical protein
VHLYVVLILKRLRALLQDASLFDEAYARHFSSSSPATSQIRVTVSDDVLDETVSLDPAGNSRLNSFSRDGSIDPHAFGCDMDMATYQAQLAEATNALLVADKCKKNLYTSQKMNWGKGNAYT